MNLKKEIRLADLFTRRANEPQATAAPAAPAAPVAPGTEPARSSSPKRSLKPSFRRSAKDPDFDAGPARGRRPKREKARRRREDAPQVPQIPLMRAFNLLPSDDVRQRGAQRRTKPAQLVVAVVALVVFAALGSLFLVTNARVADKQRQYDDLREQLAARELPVEAPGAAAGDAALVQERDGRRAALASALGSRVAWDRVLRELSLVLPEDVWLTGLTGTSGGADPGAATDPNAAAESSFEIKGYARRHEDVALLLSRMGVLPEVEAASLISATAVVVAGEPLVEFVLKATVKPGGGGSA
jgi:Tfp pilus assembly protein PilN